MTSGQIRIAYIKTDNKRSLRIQSAEVDNNSTDGFAEHPLASETSLFFKKKAKKYISFSDISSSMLMMLEDRFYQCAKNVNDYLA